MGPSVYRKARVQVHEAGISAAPGFPDPDHVRRGRPAGPESAADGRAIARRRVVRAVDEGVAETGGGAVKRRAENVLGAVEVHDGVAAGDVER